MKGDRDKQLEVQLEKKSKDDEEDRVHPLEALRVEISRFMRSSLFGFVYDKFFIAISIFSALQYIVSTYITDQLLIYYFTIIEKSLASLFIWDWVFAFYLAEHKVKFLTR